MMTRAILAGALVLLSLSGCEKPAEKSQTASVYNPRQTFAPFRMPTPVNGTRGPDGAPG